MIRPDDILFRPGVASDYPGMLALQKANFIGNLTEKEAVNGFLSIEYTEQQFDEINRDLGIAVAVRNDTLLGYLCGSTFGYGQRFPVLKALIQSLEGRTLGGRELTPRNTFIYGPVCIAVSVRGSGLLSGLFAEMSRMTVSRYDSCVLFVSAQNSRSYNAHSNKLGMQELGGFALGNNVFHILGAALPHGG